MPPETGVLAPAKPEVVREESAWIGRVLGEKYRLDAELGRGGMGIVFRAQHTLTERAVAVKVLLREFATDQTLGQRFIREAKAAARIRHPNVVDVLDYGVEPDGTPYQVIELLDGESLRERLERGVLSTERALEISLPLLNALAHAHDLGIVHRDLKPDNIFLARNATGRVLPKLLDFGIAKMRTTTGDDDPLRTRAGAIMGTPAYMSPEQASGHADVGVATDVWSMGAILFECLSGQMLFDAATLPLLLSKIIVGPAPRVNDVLPSLPQPIAQALDRSLRHDPHERFASAREMETELRIAAAASGLSVPAYDASDFRPTGRPPDAPSSSRNTALVSMSTIPASPSDGIPAPTRSGEDLVAMRPAIESSHDLPSLPGRSHAPMWTLGAIGVAGAIALALWSARPSASPTSSAPLSAARTKDVSSARPAIAVDASVANPVREPRAEIANVEAVQREPAGALEVNAAPVKGSEGSQRGTKRPETRDAPRSGARARPGGYDPPPLAGW